MQKSRLSRVALGSAIALVTGAMVFGTAAAVPGSPVAQDPEDATIVQPTPDAPAASPADTLRMVGPGGGGIAVASDPGQPDGPDRVPKKAAPAPPPAPAITQGVQGTQPDPPIAAPRPTPVAEAPGSAPGPAVVAPPDPPPEAPAPVAIPDEPAPALSPDAPPA